MVAPIQQRNYALTNISQNERPMGQPAARLTDMHVCPMVTVLVPHVGGPIVAVGAPTVLVGMLPAARVTDMMICVGPPDVIVKGSATVLIGGLPAARMGDMTAHGGVIVLGLPTVLIGDASSGGGGAGGGGGGGGSGGGTGTAPNFASLLSSGAALSAPVQQAKALVQAAKKGTPFCARCHAAPLRSAPAKKAPTSASQRRSRK